MRLKQSDRKEVHDKAVVQLINKLKAPIDEKLNELAELLWEHHCGEASLKVLEAGIDPRFYVTRDRFEPYMKWDDRSSPTTLKIRWSNTYGFWGSDKNPEVTKIGKTFKNLVNMSCTMPEQRPAPLSLSPLECETEQQKALLREIYNDLTAAFEEVKGFSKQVDQVLASAKTLKQLEELSPTLAAWVTVPEPKKHLPLPVEAANMVNETLNKLKSDAA